MSSHSKKTGRRKTKSSRKNSNYIRKKRALEKKELNEKKKQSEEKRKEKLTKKQLHEIQSGPIEIKYLFLSNSSHSFDPSAHYYIGELYSIFSYFTLQSNKKINREDWLNFGYKKGNHKEAKIMKGDRFLRRYKVLQNKSITEAISHIRSRLFFDQEEAFYMLDIIYNKYKSVINDFSDSSLLSKMSDLNSHIISLEKFSRRFEFLFSNTQYAKPGLGGRYTTYSRNCGILLFGNLETRLRKVEESERTNGESDKLAYLKKVIKKHF